MFLRRGLGRVHVDDEQKADERGASKLWSDPQKHSRPHASHFSDSDTKNTVNHATPSLERQPFDGRIATG